MKIKFKKTVDQKTSRKTVRNNALKLMQWKSFDNILIGLWPSLLHCDVYCVKGGVWKARSWDQSTESWPGFSRLHAAICCDGCTEAGRLQLQSISAPVYTQLCK